MNYLFVCFGAEQSYYIQAKYAILTLLAFSPEASVHIATDHAERFADFSTEINCIPLTDEQKTEWLSPINSPFAIKLFAIEYASQQLPGSLVYLDTDVIIHTSLTPLLDQLNDTSALMYQKEFLLKDVTTPLKLLIHQMRHKLGSKALYKKRCHMAHETRNKTWAGFYADNEQAIWNSGVIGVNQANKPLLKGALAVYRALQDANIHYFAIEQLALTITLQTRTLIEAIPYVYQYWHDKKNATAAVTQRLLEFEQQNLSFTEMLEQVREQPFPKTLPIVLNPFQLQNNDV